MTVNISNVGTNNTFDFWRNRTNELAYSLSVLAVTANGSNAAVGNAAITGKFTADSLVINTTAHVNNSLLVGNNTVDAFSFTIINTSAISVGNSTVNSFLDFNSLNTYAVYVGSNVVVNASQLFITSSIGGNTTNVIANSSTLLFRSNTTVNSIANSTLLQISNGSGSAILNYNSLSIGSSLVNSTSISMLGSNSLFANTEAVTVGSNVFMNTSTMVIGNTTTNVLSNSSTILVGNTTVNAFVNSSLVRVANSTISANITSVSFAVGTSLVNSTIITTGAGGLVANTSSVTVGSNVVANTSELRVSVSTSNVLINAIAVDIGNTTVNSLANATLIRIANSSGQANLDPLSLTIGTSVVNSTIITTGSGGLIANTTTVRVGTNVQINTSSFFVGNSSVYTDQSINQIIIANNSGSANLNPVGLTIGTSIVNSTVITTGTNSLVANSTSVRLGLSSAPVVANSSGLTIGGNVQINGAFANITNTLFVGGDLSVSGNLTYTGITTSNLIPASSDLYTIGSPSLRWNSLWATNANLTLNVTVGNNIAIGVSTTANSSGVYTPTVNATSFTIGSSFVANTTVVNAASFTIGSVFTANSTVVNTVSVNAVSVNTGLVTIGNSTVNVVANSSSLRVANSTTSIIIVNPNSSSISSGQHYLNANGSWAAITSPTINATITTTGTSTQEIDSYAMVSFPAAEYIVSVVDNNANNRYMSKILTTHDRGAGYMTEFATITTNTDIGTFSFIAPNVSHVSLRFTPVSTNTTVKYVRTIVS